MDPKEPGAASTQPAGEPATQSEPQEPAIAKEQPTQKAGENSKASPKSEEKKTLKERWAEAKALRAAAKEDSKKDGHILKNFAVCALPWSSSF